jgi:hypothetical protein
MILFRITDKDSKIWNNMKKEIGKRRMGEEEQGRFQFPLLLKEGWLGQFII